MAKELKQMFVGEEIRSFSKAHYNNHEINNNTTGSKQQGQIEHNQHQQYRHQPPVSNRYSVELRYDSIIPEARRPTKLTISITQKSGIPVREFEPVHDKLMHLIIVDLSYFAHIHPVLENNGEKFTIVHTFPEAGTLD